MAASNSLALATLGGVLVAKLRRASGPPQQLETPGRDHLHAWREQAHVRLGGGASSRYNLAFRFVQFEAHLCRSRLDGGKGGRHRVATTGQTAIVQVGENEVQTLARIPVFACDFTEDRLEGQREKQRSERVPLLHARL